MKTVPVPPCHACQGKLHVHQPELRTYECTQCGFVGMASISWESPPPAPPDDASKPCGLTYATLVVAGRNFGLDLSCGSCASQFYTGYGGYGHDKTCATEQSIPVSMLSDWINELAPSSAFGTIEERAAQVRNKMRAAREPSKVEIYYSDADGNRLSCAVHGCTDPLNLKGQTLCALHLNEALAARDLDWKPS